MLYSIFRGSIRSRLSCPTHYALFSPFSSAVPNPISEAADKQSLIVNYLINAFGFSQEKAFATSKYLKLDSIEKPESVFTFFKNRGFTDYQIGIIVRGNPLLIKSDPLKIFAPKIDFFLSMGISQTEVHNIILTAPSILQNSLENQIIPSFNNLKSFFSSNGTSLSFTKRLAVVLRCNLESQLIPNVEILKEAGVPVSKIMVLLQYQPRSFMVDADRFREVVEEVKLMNFSPQRLNFVLAVHAIRSVTKLTWEKKVAVYKKWGLSDSDILLAFERRPYFMMFSTDKITAVMGFLVNEMGFDASFVVKRPDTLSYSLEQRIKPRCSVYKVLLENGLMKDSFLNSIFSITEMKFLKIFVQQYEKEVPGLMQLYEKGLAFSKT